MWGKQQEAGTWYVYPALFALALSLTDILYFALFFKESLPPAKRSQSTSQTLEQVAGYINPLQLFR